MNAQLGGIEGVEIIAVFKFLAVGVVAAYLVYLLAGVVGISHCLCEKFLAVHGEVLSCDIKADHKQIGTAGGLGEVDYLADIALGYRVFA